jgi:hypothetical protein
VPRRLALLLPAALLAAGCGSTDQPAADPPASTPQDPASTPAASGSGDLAPLPRAPALPASAVRPPHPRSADMDTNPANLASAVVTYAFGKLPVYIDGGSFRLLQYDMFRAATPGVTVRRAYRATLPRTQMILDTAVVSGQERSEVTAEADQYVIAVSLDGRWVQQPQRHWVFYRNDGPQICRIYFPDDLSSLQMGVNSMVLRRLSPGPHHVRVLVEEELVPGTPPARFVTDYRLRVLDRGPGARERAIAPPEDSAPPTDRTPLAFSASSPVRH